MVINIIIIIIIIIIINYLFMYLCKKMLIILLSLQEYVGSILVYMSLYVGGGVQGFILFYTFISLF